MPIASPMVSGWINAANFVSAQIANQLARQIIALDANAGSLLMPLAGRSLLIRFDDLASGYYLLFSCDTIQIQSFQARPVNQPDATISGNFSAFLQAATSADAEDLTLRGDLHFSGSLQLARQFEQLLKQLAPDWEEPIASAFGDVAGHQISQFLKGLLRWLRLVAHSATTDLSEYLQHELAVTPPAAEQHLLFQQISELRSRSDRLAARIARLNQFIGKDNIR